MTSPEKQPNAARGVNDDEWRAAMLECLIGLGRDLGIQTTAEGIETPEQLHILQHLGCDCGQGYLLGRPMSSSDVQDFIAHWHRGDGPIPVADEEPAVVDQRRVA